MLYPPIHPTPQPSPPLDHFPQLLQRHINITPIFLPPLDFHKEDIMPRRFPTGSTQNTREIHPMFRKHAQTLRKRSGLLSVF